MMTVGGDDGDFICIVTGQMGVDEDEEVCNSGGEREGWLKAGPGMGVCIEDDGEEGGSGACKMRRDAFIS